MEITNFQGFQDFEDFPETYIFHRWYYAWLPNTDRGVRREQDVPRMSGSRFQSRTHALLSLEPNGNRFGDFYFSMKIMIFRKFLEIL